MTHVLRDMLSRTKNRTIIMDGGMGTTCEDRGINTHNALWGSFALLTDAGLRINDEIHADFVAAGAKLLIANTHNAIRASCEDQELLKSVDCAALTDFVGITDSKLRATAIHGHLLEAAVASAKRAIPKGQEVAVATCIGSVDTPYATEASVDANKAADILEFEIWARQAVDCDLIILETLTTREEIAGAARAVSNCNVPVAIGLTCGENGKTLGGVTMNEAVQLFKDSSVDLYFIQCTRYSHVERAFRSLKNAANADDVLGVYANDGRSWDHTSMTWAQTVRITPEIYAEYAALWQAMGARIIGGCCGTSPEHIGALVERLVVG